MGTVHFVVNPELLPKVNCLLKSVSEGWRAGEAAPQVKVLAARSEDLHWVPGTRVVEGEPIPSGPDFHANVHMYTLRQTRVT